MLLTNAFQDAAVRYQEGHTSIKIIARMMQISDSDHPRYTNTIQGFNQLEGVNVNRMPNRSVLL